MPCDGAETQRRQTQSFQRLKAAIDLSVADIFSQEETDFAADSKALAVSAELVLDKLFGIARDLEAFAGHAKRSTVNSEDVKLLARNNPKLKEHLTNLGVERAQLSTGRKTTEKGKKNAKSTGGLK